MHGAIGQQVGDAELHRITGCAQGDAEQAEYQPVLGIRPPAAGPAFRPATTTKARSTDTVPSSTL